MIVSTKPPDFPFFWTVRLTNGLEVFEDFRVGLKGAWLRLKDLLKNEGWGVSMLSLVSPTSVLILKDQDGFFFSNKIEVYASGSLNFERMYKGVGFYKGGQVHITWFNLDSGEITNEVRMVSSDNPAIILRVNHDQKLLA